MCNTMFSSSFISVCCLKGPHGAPSQRLELPERLLTHLLTRRLAMSGVVACGVPQKKPHTTHVQQQGQEMTQGDAMLSGANKNQKM
eukprot:1826435-Rhodomonas_salina.1